MTYNKPYDQYIIEHPDIKYDISLFRYRLLNILKCKHISQNQLARDLNVNKSTMSQILTNGRHINIKTIICIADYLDVPLEFLCGDKRYKDDYTSIANCVNNKQSWEMLLCNEVEQ